MAENVTIQFQAGMNRRVDAPAQAPYELHNAKLGVHGGVRAYRAPEVMEDPAVTQEPNTPDEPGGEKPWIRWNDQWFSRFSDSFTDADGEPVEVLQNHDKHNGNLYVTGTKSRRLSGDDQKSPHTWRVDKNANGFNPFVLSEPPAITSIAVSGSHETGEARSGDVLNTSDKKGGIKGKRAVSYLAIPVNERGAAGPWVYFSHYPKNDDVDQYRAVTYSINTNGEAKYVEVYRTREWKEVYELTSQGMIPPPDLSYYYLDRVSLNPDGIGDNASTSGTLVDANHWAHEYESEEKAANVLPTDTNDRKINAWTYESVDYNKYQNYVDSLEVGYSFVVDLGPPVHVGAEAMRMVGRDRMMYGAPQWPLKPVQFAMATHDTTTSRNSDWGNSTGSRLYAYEYSVASEDSVVYGPPTTIDGDAHPIWQGEQAVNMWTGGGSEYSDRNTAKSNGVYTTDSGSLYNIDVDIFDPFEDTTATQYPEDVNNKKWVEEPNVVLLSERFRPLEVTFEDQYQVPEGESIRAFSPARLAEEDSIANYSFYIYTDEGVHSGELTQDNAQTYRVSTVGVKNYTVSPDNAPVYQKSLYRVTKYGSVYIGTDNRVYSLRGRKFNALDSAVPNIWYSDLSEPQFSDVEYQAIYNNYSDVWSQVGGFDGDKTLTPYDIAYDQHRDQIMVATLNNVWIFDIDQKGWVGNYNVSGVENLQYIGSLESSNTATHKAVMAHKNPGANAEYVLLNEDGDPLTDNAVVTNPILRSPNESKIREVTADYDPLSRNADVSLTSGSKTVNVESGDSFDTDSPSLDKMATVFIPQGEDGGSKNLTGLIGSVTDATTAELTEPAGVDAASTSPIPLRWFPPAIIRQEPTGDHYSVNDVNGDPVRRTELAYKIHPRRRRYPRMNGTGHVMRVEKFRNFKSLQLKVEQSDL
jgi:hypothetical protein